MRILHVIHSLDPRSGGPVHSLRGLVRAQANAGHKVSIVCTDVQSAEPWKAGQEYLRALYTDPLFDTVGLLVVRGVGRSGSLRRLRYSRDAGKYIKRILSHKDSKPGIVHIHGLFSHLTLLAGRLSRKYQIPYIIRPAGGLDQWCFHQGNSFGKKLIWHLSLRQQLEQAAFIHATSISESDKIASILAASKIRIVPHGVDIPPGSAVLKQRTQTLLYLSRFHAKKRPLVALQAFEILQRKYPSHSIVMAGPDAGAKGECVEFVRQRGLDRVEFRDFVHGEEKERLLSTSNALLLPSRHENFGVVVLEALAHGLPVITTPDVDTHSYVLETGCGRITNATPEDFAAAVEVIISTDATESQWKAIEYVKNNLIWEKISKKMIQAYQEAINGET